MNTTELFLVAMLVIFTVPYLVWRLGRTDYFAPRVVVQIVTVPAPHPVQQAAGARAGTAAGRAGGSGS